MYMVYVLYHFNKVPRLYAADIRKRVACGYLKQKLRNTVAATL